MKGVLAIRPIFSLVDMITNTKFSHCPNVFIIGEFGSKICIVSTKIRFKAIHHLQYHETCTFYSQLSFYVFILGAV